MARIRTVKPSFFTSDDVCRCQPLARLLFIGLWCEADKAGRLIDKPGQIRMRVLPGDVADVDVLLWELTDAGLIRRYVSDDGTPILQVMGFERHQRPHPKEPKSVLAVDGNERTRPAMSSPGCIPSSPVGMDKEYGVSDDLESGVRSSGNGAAKNATAAAGPTRVQSDGPLAGSLPRDHIAHGFCGRRFCVTSKHFSGLSRTYGDGGDAALTAWLTDFDARLDGAFGGPVWLSQHWDAHLVEIGRVTPAPARKSGKPNWKDEMRAKWAAEGKS